MIGHTNILTEITIDRYTLKKTHNMIWKNEFILKQRTAKAKIKEQQKNLRTWSNNKRERVGKEISNSRTGEGARHLRAESEEIVWSRN